MHWTAHVNGVQRTGMGSSQQIVMFNIAAGWELVQDGRYLSLQQHPILMPAHPGDRTAADSGTALHTQALRTAMLQGRMAPAAITTAAAAVMPYQVHNVG